MRHPLREPRPDRHICDFVEAGELDFVEAGELDVGDYNCCWVDPDRAHWSIDMESGVAVTWCYYREPS